MIRRLNKNDRADYLEMAKMFYKSDAVTHSVDSQNIKDTFDELLKSDTYAECYIMEDNGNTAGYALLAKTFSQEAGGVTMWLEELYVKPDFQGAGLGNEFLKFMKENILPKVKRLRLEVTDVNKRAISLYEKFGYEPLEYSQMILENNDK